ncbi:hypothetical protein, partial [Bosea vaviloviae]
ALSEQSAASAGSLSSRIAQLNALVAAFRTGNEGAGMAGSAPSRPSAPVIRASDRKPAAAVQPTSEPARLRKLAEVAFGQKPAASVTSSEPPPVKKVVNSRGGDSGWEEF